MDKLDNIRQEIDRIDREMAALFEQRMAAAAEVAACKQAHGLPVLDEKREAAVVEKNLARLHNRALEDLYADYLRHLMALSRAHQQRLMGRDAAAYPGGEGSFAHEAARALFPHGRLLALPTFAAVFEAVESGAAAFGVVPFENSGTGDVSGVLDLCYSHSCHITGMYDLPVVQNLLGLPGATLAGVRTVYSHPQALEQSARFLASLGVQCRPYASTALAAGFVAGQGDASLAAVASEAAAHGHGLVLLAENIATEPHNTTRFIVLERRLPEAGNRFSLLVAVENKVGQLAQVIETIAAEGFNMEAIKSRPMPHRPWEYYFYIELVGNAAAGDAQALLQKLAGACLSVRLLGLYTKEG